MRTPFHATPPTPDFQPPRPSGGDRPAVRHPGLSPIRHADGGIGAGAASQQDQQGGEFHAL